MGESADDNDGKSAKERGAEIAAQIAAEKASGDGDNDNGEGEDNNILWQLGVTVLVLIFAPWGLIFEPGPLSELTSLGILASVWGIPILGGEDEN